MKALQLTGICSLLFFSSMISAQTDTPDAQVLIDALKKVRGITDTVKRLEAYDHLASAYSPKSADTAAPSGWDESVEINPLDDARTVVLLKWEENMTLAVRHSLGKTELFVDTHEYMGIDSSAVIYRAGKTDAISSLWDISSNNKALFYKGDIDALIHQLAASDQFVVQATPYGKNPITAVFDIRGLKQLLVKYKEDFGYEIEGEEKEGDKTK